jgi:subtilisin family serine protease
MRKKIFGIFIVTLLIGTTLPTLGTIIETSTINENELNTFFNSEFVLGEFIVKFKEPLFSSVSINDLNEKYQVKSMEKLFVNSENTILDNIYILKVPDNSDILSIVNDYSMNPNVEYAEVNIIGDLCLTPNDEYFQYQWYLHNTGQNIIPPDYPYPPIHGTIDADIDAPEAWDIETGSQDVIIALIDSGIDYTHPDLADRIWVNEDEIPDNEVDDDGNGFIDDIIGWDFPYNDNDPLDLNGHGTACGGVFSAVTNNNIGIAGISWNCRIMITNIAYDDGVNDISDWVKAIQYAADNGADILSMQILAYIDKAVLRDAIDYAYDKGVFMCASAGNDNTSDEGYPAANDKVLAVAATNEHDERCDEDDFSWNWAPGRGSNYGDWIDIAAPGNLIATTSTTYPNYKNLPMNYTGIGGTSISCPIVAGVAALLLSRDSSLSPEDVKTLICENVDPYDSEYYIGTGRVNAYKALLALNSPPNKPEIDGSTSGKPGEEQEFIISAIDDHEDDVSYIIDWGDDSGEETIGSFPSGEKQTVSHVWNEEGDYTIKVKAQDVIGAESNWSTFEVSMPKAYIHNQIIQLIMKLLNNFRYRIQIWKG